ncbi:MAG: FAD binding domain-containing protein [Rhodococcus sp. (in: high G+C Gram-positive bacteria)]|uniref:FAD binding domain-containing protein n=1 Tax=Rhodococcus sp. TaxID=1831 RepID=UPI002AD9342D|nr:FAD binding domain-containing protein [Rhodococcus sp. (in: high G+C Gram-positive bacteria)]
MDITTITDVIRRPPDRPGDVWRPGDAWLAGGTWLFSAEQPDTRRLVDLTGLGWTPLEVSATHFGVGATCTVAELYAFVPPDNWRASPLIRVSCEYFLSSFKVWNSATVGGNICMSLPAGPMITLAVALEATFTLWATAGTVRTVDACDFVTGDHQNVLEPGEVLRSIEFPVHALTKRHAHRRFSLTHLGRSTIFMIATQTPGADDFHLTITAGTTHPIRLTFDAMPDEDSLRRAVDSISADSWFDDPNGTPDHRLHLARHYADELRIELTGSQS